MKEMRLRAAAAVLALAAQLLPAGQARPFRFDELAKVGRIGGFALSPDGKWIAYRAPPRSGAPGPTAKAPRP